MEKIVVHKPGGYERLRLERFEDPSPAPGEVVVRTQAIGVNYADCCVRWGVYESAKLYVGWPITPGFEFSGEIVAAGDGVAAERVGETVFGITRFGGYSTHVKVPAGQVFKVPSALSFEQAAGFPAVYMTAFHALCQLVVVRPGQRVLIHSAAGGVGTALLQIGKVLGLKTVGVVGSSHKVETAKRFGAEHVIDKSTQDLWKEARRLAPEGYDVVLDANGPATLKQSYEILRPTGKLVTYGFHTMLPKTGGKIQYLKAGLGLLRLPRFNPMKLVNENKSIIGFNVSFLFERADLLEEGMETLARWLDEKKISGPAVETFPFKDVARAHQRIESGQSVGKLVLIPGVAGA